RSLCRAETRSLHAALPILPGKLRGAGELPGVTVFSAMPNLLRGAMRSGVVAEPTRVGANRSHRRANGPMRDAAIHARKQEYDKNAPRSEEHTSELQSREKLVCRLLLEKK